MNSQQQQQRKGKNNQILINLSNKKNAILHLIKEKLGRKMGEMTNKSKSRSKNKEKKVRQWVKMNNLNLMLSGLYGR